MSHVMLDLESTGWEEHGHFGVVTREEKRLPRFLQETQRWSRKASPHGQGRAGGIRVAVGLNTVFPSMVWGPDHSGHCSRMAIPVPSSPFGCHVWSRSGMDVTLRRSLSLRAKV
jgi:hypothetical protein